MFTLRYHVAKLSFKEAIAYRFSMLFSLVTGPLIVMTNYVIWKAVFAASGKAMIGNYTFSQMITQVTIGMATFYLMWDDVNETVERHIDSGSLIAFLLKPTDLMTYEYWAKVGHRMLAFLIEFVPVILICGVLLGFDIFKKGHWLFYFASVLIGTTVYYLIGMLIGMCAFWLSKSRGVRKLYFSVSWILTGAALPLSLYPEAVQKVFFFLPFQFLGFVPARMFLGEYALAGFTFNPYQTLLFGLCYVVVMWIGVSLLWRFSVKRFCGAGA